MKKIKVIITWIVILTILTLPAILAEESGGGGGTSSETSFPESADEEFEFTNYNNLQTSNVKTSSASLDEMNAKLEFQGNLNLGLILILFIFIVYVHFRAKHR